VVRQRTDAEILAIAKELGFYFVEDRGGKCDYCERREMAEAFDDVEQWLRMEAAVHRRCARELGLIW